MYLYIYIHLHAGIYHTYTCTHTSTYTNQAPNASRAPPALLAFVTPLSLAHTLCHTHSQDVTAALLKRCRSFPPAPAPWHGHPALRGWSITLPCCLIVFIIVSLMLCSEGRVLCYNSIVRSYHALGSWQSFSPAVALSKVGGTLARPSPISLTSTTDKLRKLAMCVDLELARSLRCAANSPRSGLPRGDCSRAGFEVQLEVRDGDGAPTSSSCMSSSESISPCSALNGFVASK